MSHLTTNFVFHTVIFDTLKGELPTIDEIETVWDLPEPPLDKVTDDIEENDHRLTEDYHEMYDRKVAVFSWYVEEYLPMAAGVQWFGPTIRPYFLPSDLIDMPSGEKKVCVTITSEAYGLLVYENCRDKWLEIFKWRDLQPKSKKNKPPTYTPSDPATHKFKAKWSDSNIGQNTGWNTDAYTRFAVIMEHIKAFRLQDEANGKVAQINGRTWIRSVHGIKDVEEEEPPKKKRKGATNSGGKQQNDAENQVSIVYFDE